MADRTFSGNLVRHLEKNATEIPSDIAIISTGGSPFKKTFNQLHEDVILCSIFFKKKGVQRNDRVLLMVKPGYELIICCFALLFIGAIPIIIDPGMGLKSLLKCIKRSKPQTLIAIDIGIWISTLFRTTFSSLRLKIRITKNLLGEAKRKFIINPTQMHYSQDKDLAAIVFTSGSTGSPKGVRYLHRNFNAQIQTLEREFGIQKGEVDMVTLPIFSLFNPALGVTSVIPEMNPRKPAKANAEKLVQTILDHQVTSAFCSPVIGKKISDYCQKHGVRLKSVQRIMLAGAPVTPKVVHRLASYLPSGKIFIPYGATEALPVSYSNHNQISRLSQSIINGEGSCLGKPINDVSIQLMPVKNSPIPNQDEDEIIPVTTKFETGEICVSGICVTDGYDQMPGATRDARFKFNSKTYHRMGDLGYWDDEGNLRFLGRKAECVQTKFGPLETERCEPIINNLSGVHRCALIGIGTERIQEPCLVVELSNDKSNITNLSKRIYSIIEENFVQFGMRRLFFQRRLPVDARHNAKIHRLALSQKWSKKVLKDQTIGIKK